MTANHIIVVMLIIGLVMLIAAGRMDSKSSFEDGSFMIQILLLLVGAVMIAGGLLWKLIMSLVE